MIDFAQETLASLVTKNHHAVEVLEKYRLDFCCKGKRTLEDACKENDIVLTEVISALAETAGPSFKHFPFEAMTAEQLIQYILLNHHFYVKQALPRILQHIQKVAAKHGDRFSYMIKVYENFCAVYEEMTLHMEKEEKILFPRIKEMEQALQANGSIQYSVDYVKSPIRMMEQEHEHAGSLMQEISDLTNDYTPPESACTTFSITLAELKEFEEDLHKHVHLENYILFPKAEKMIGEFLS
jgi:regulator of cell morphogenesis and NO signaling